MDVYNVTPTQLYCPNCGYNVLISYDTYYVRTQKRDIHRKGTGNAGREDRKETVLFGGL